MRIAEVHSTDLTEPCMRKTYHRHRGEVTGEATTALYRGLVAGKALELLHGDWDEPTPELTIAAASDVAKSLVDEGRIISDSVENNRQDILAEVSEVVDLYRDRFEPLFSKCQFIGAEVPVRLSLPFGEFASHLDLLVRDTHNSFGWGKGRLVCFDWKWRADTATYPYLARNLQFALYYLMILKGKTKAFEGKGEFDWISFEEEATVAWLDLTALKPYRRKTTTINEVGELVERKKGDLRPMKSILKGVNYGNGAVHDVEEELKNRIKLFDLGIYPLNPHPVACMVCEAEAFCSRFDMTQTGDTK